MNLVFLNYYFSPSAPGYPVRRKYPQAASDRLMITSDVIMEEPCGDHKEDGVGKEQEASTCSKRLLPDRTHAAHNRANEKLVHFIVKKRMVEKHLLVGFFLLLLMQRGFFLYPVISDWGPSKKQVSRLLLQGYIEVGVVVVFFFVFF